MSLLTLDHIAVAAPDLATGVRWVRERLGVDVPVGGAHPQMGTHNHLLGLGSSDFLEVIAVDPAAPKPAGPRWFALDRHGDRAPYLATWVVRTASLALALSALSPSVGAARPASRGDLAWLITVPDDGAMPFDGAHPTVIEWQVSPLPVTRMADAGCRLRRLTVEHPNADVIARRLAPLFRDPRVDFVVAPAMRLAAEIETPAGVRRI